MIAPFRGGGLDRLTDSQFRPLRPVGSSVRDVAVRTGRLLRVLRGIPGVRVAAGVRVPGARQPIGFAVTAGARLLLIESVAWPGGTYSTAPDGRVFCDGIYIGQSVRPLVGSVRRLRRMLPRDHRVNAAVVVHPFGTGRATLPETAPAALSWVDPADVTRHLCALLQPAGSGRRPAEPSGRVMTSPRHATPRG